MSVAFTKEESAETASETQLPDRPISAHPNLVTSTGLQALRSNLEIARKAYEQAKLTTDVNEKRRLSANPLRDIRYLTERIRTAQVVACPASNDVVAFGHTVTFARADGRIQTYRIVGEDESRSKERIDFVCFAGRQILDWTGAG
jgi:transcription elongation GreA/GreB family factor